MARKEAMIDTKTPGSWQYFFAPLWQVLLLALRLQKCLKILCLSLLVTSAYEKGNGKK